MTLLKAHEPAWPEPPASRFQPGEAKPQTRYVEVAPQEWDEFQRWKIGTLQPLAAELRELRLSIVGFPTWFGSMAGVLEQMERAQSLLGSKALRPEDRPAAEPRSLADRLLAKARAEIAAERAWCQGSLEEQVAELRQMTATALAWKAALEGERDQLCARIEAAEKKYLRIDERDDQSIKARATMAAMPQPKHPMLR